MANYTDEATIEALVGHAIDATGTSRPTTAQLAVMLTLADGIINSEARSAALMTDTYGELAMIASELVMRMINNLYSLSDPKLYAREPLDLTPSQIRTIHMVHGRWTADTFDVGE